MTVDGIQLCLEAFGDEDDPAVLLIAGAAASMDLWEPEFCARLADCGRYVIRYDHRDTGRSATSPRGHPTYTSDELTTDALRVLDALDIPRAHLVGMSMGGGLVQVLAVRHADRVRTLTLMSTSAAGDRADTRPLPSMQAQLAAIFEDPPADPDWDDPEVVISYLVDAERPYAGTLGFDEQRVRRTKSLVVDRSRDVAAGSNHWVLAGEQVSFAMAAIGVPTLVLHGTADPFFPIEHGEALAAEIPDARLVPLEGMGHEAPPPELWDTVIDAISDHTFEDSRGRP